MLALACVSEPAPKVFKNNCPVCEAIVRASITNQGRDALMLHCCEMLALPMVKIATTLGASEETHMKLISVLGRTNKYLARHVEEISDWLGADKVGRGHPRYAAQYLEFLDCRCKLLEP